MTYSHVLTNQGNQAEGGTCSAMSFSGDNSLAGDGWTSVVYYDANNNGELDPSDPVVESLAQITASGNTPTAPPPWRARCLRARVCACSSRSSLRRARRRRNRQPHAAGHRQEQHRRRRLRQPRTGRAKRGGHQQRDDRADPAAQGTRPGCEVRRRRRPGFQRHPDPGQARRVRDLSRAGQQPGRGRGHQRDHERFGPGLSTYVDIKDSSICTPVRPPRRPMAAPARSPATWVNSSLAPRPRCSSTSSWTTDRPFPFAWAQALASDSGGSAGAASSFPKP